MTLDLVVMLVLLVFLMLVTIDCQHDANHVLYMKAVWPWLVLGDQAWTSTTFTKHALLAFSKIQQVFSLRYECWHLLCEFLLVFIVSKHALFISADTLRLSVEMYTHTHTHTHMYSVHFLTKNL